uniref:Gag-Pol polyprotein n=1 Tax=Tanacetum cinerariifolium TaxID=118510 RepID=A0A6L2N9C4_TANCI|nr:hypothetical protein [Tanacetum cinerariifolium]
MEADDQAIQTILMGLPEDIYAVVDREKAKLFNEWEMFTSTEGESIDYHRFAKTMNDFAKNKHYPEPISSNLKFLNNLQPKWKRSVTIVHQVKDLYKVNYTQLYDFLKMNQEETQLLIAQKEKAMIQLQAKEFDLMDATADYEEIKEVNVNSILMDNVKQASTSSTHNNKALV